MLTGGPDRVVVDFEGYAVPPKRAREEYGIAVETVFVRDDGWMLGATKAMSHVAYAQWSKYWIGVIDVVSSDGDNHSFRPRLFESGNEIEEWS